MNIRELFAEMIDAPRWYVNHRLKYIVERTESIKHEEITCSRNINLNCITLFGDLSSEIIISPSE